MVCKFNRLVQVSYDDDDDVRLCQGALVAVLTQ